MISSQRKKTSPRQGRRLRIVVTAGPTREYFDSVRFISNPSTGKMGYALAEAAAAAGHRVTLIRGPVELPALKGVKTIRVTTAAQMATATKQAFPNSDAAILTAAVCDYRPQRQGHRKLAKKHQAKRVILVPTEDIAAALGRVKAERITIAFAMEDHDGRAHAERKMRRKNCDAIVLNGPQNVGADHCRVDFLEKGGRWQRWPIGTKRAIAKRLVKAVERLVDAAMS